MCVEYYKITFELGKRSHTLVLNKELNEFQTSRVVIEFAFHHEYNIF